MAKKGSTRKPAKPYAGYPLFAHASGSWVKKIDGKLHYFGGWGDPDGALQRYHDYRNGGTAQSSIGETVANLVNHFLAHKEQMVESGELAARSFQRYHSTCALLVESFGKDRRVEGLAADDFQRLRVKMTGRWGPVAVGNEIQMVRTIFKYGYDAGLIDKPIRFGPGFKKPSAKTLRKARTAGGLKMFQREELSTVLEHAGVNMKGMVLLGINAAMGNTDIGLLPTVAVNLETGWLDYPRDKTSVERRVPLWPETIDALKKVLASRRAPNDPADARLLFIGRRGQSYVGKHKGYRVTAEMTRTLKKAGLQRPGLSFYCLRRTFQTIGEDARDLVAVQAIMGHARRANNMSVVYRQRISDERLGAVTEHVRRWLFSADGQESREGFLAPP